MQIAVHASLRVFVVTAGKMNLPFHSIKSPVEQVNDYLLLNNHTNGYELYREHELSSTAQSL